MNAEVSSARRWVADPLSALGPVALVTLALTVAAIAGSAVPPFVLVLLGVTAAGLALSGST